MAKVKDLYVLGQWVYFYFHILFLLSHSLPLSLSSKLLFIVVFVVFGNLLLFHYHFDKAAIFWCVVCIVCFFSLAFLRAFCALCSVAFCVREVLHLSPITCLKVPNDKRKQKQNVHQIW